jgi:uncharacterized RDD family membrane protein YckC
MEREERLAYCKKCKKRKFSREKGLVCSITDEYATFDDTCSDFEEDIIEQKQNSVYVRPQSIDDKAVSSWLRFANYIIDGIVLYGVEFVLGFILAILNVRFVFNMNRFQEIIFTLVVHVIYYIILESTFQVTLGKLITGTVVIDINGNKPNLTTIVKRSFTRIVPFDALSFLGNDAIGWHDTWSETRVVSKKHLKNNTNSDGNALDEEFIND